MTTALSQKQLPGHGWAKTMARDSCLRVVEALQGNRVCAHASVCVHIYLMLGGMPGEAGMRESTYACYCAGHCCIVAPHTPTHNLRSAACLVASSSGPQKRACCSLHQAALTPASSTRRCGIPGTGRLWDGDTLTSHLHSHLQAPT